MTRASGNKKILQLKNCFWKNRNTLYSVMWRRYLEYIGIQRRMKK
jgi:hypothetical protein